MTHRAIDIAFPAGLIDLINWDSSKPDGTPQKLLDVDQLQSMGWSASISLAEGLQKVIINLTSALAPAINAVSCPMVASRNAVS